MTEIQLAGNERAAIEKLQMALSYCVEASAAGFYKSTIEATRHAVEAATEVGTFRSDGRWALLAAHMDKARVALASMTSAMFGLQSLAISNQFSNIREKVQGMTHAKIIH